MQKLVGVALLCLAATGVAAAGITNRGMPNCAKLYHPRADCHIAYDLLIGNLDKRRPVSDADQA